MQTILAAETLLAVGILLGVPPIPAIAQDKKPDSATTPTQVAQRAVHRHAVEAIVWGMPAVNFDLMYQAMVRDAKAGAGSNKIVYHQRWQPAQRRPGHGPG